MIDFINEARKLEINDSDIFDYLTSKDESIEHDDREEDLMHLLDMMIVENRSDEMKNKMAKDNLENFVNRFDFNKINNERLSRSKSLQ